MKERMDLWAFQYQIETVFLPCTTIIIQWLIFVPLFLVAVVSWCFALPGCSATDRVKTSQHWRYYSESLSSSESLSKGSLDTTWSLFWDLEISNEHQDDVYFALAFPQPNLKAAWIVIQIIKNEHWHSLCLLLKFIWLHGLSIVAFNHPANHLAKHFDVWQSKAGPQWDPQMSVLEEAWL